MENSKPYREFGDFLREVFPYKVQKISINAGFTCPNRDGTKGFGGCTYCNNQTFSPEYCHTEKSVTEQLEAGVRFFSRKYPEMKYLAYFQAYTNTYDELDSLISKYEEALACPDVVGLIVGTRPDCMPDTLLDYFSALSQKKFVIIEYGLESTLDRTLTRINRGHTHAESEEAIRRTAARNIYTGAHLILGLPGESREEILHHADILSALPLTTLKLHQLQLIRGTRMAREQAEHPEQFHLYTADEYMPFRPGAKRSCGCSTPPVTALSARRWPKFRARRFRSRSMLPIRIRWKSTCCARRTACAASTSTMR